MTALLAWACDSLALCCIIMCGGIFFAAAWVLG